MQLGQHNPEIIQHQWQLSTLRGQETMSTTKGVNMISSTQGPRVGGTHRQGTAGTDNPFTMAAREAAACQLREQQQAMNTTTAQANEQMQTMK